MIWLRALASIFSVRGRLARAEWFSYLVFWAALCASLGAGADALAGNRAAAVFSFLFLWGAIALSTRRLHDRGTSGWVLLAFIVPVFGWVWLVVLLLRKSSEGSNRYGRDPRARLDYLRVRIHQG